MNQIHPITGVEEIYALDAIQYGRLPSIGGRGVLVPSRSCAVTNDAKTSASRETLAANLRSVRTIHGWSQESLALRCGLKRTYVGALEREEVNSGLDNLDKLASGIGVLAHILLMSPELAYARLFESFSRKEL